MKKLFPILILFLILAGFLMPTGDVQAFSLMDGVSPDCWSEGSGGSGNCSVCDILVVVYNVGKLVFMAMAAVALIMLIWAGIGLILNAGNVEMIAKSKRIILHTIIAIVIIMAAWLVVNFTIYMLAGKEPGTELDTTFWSAKVWWQGPECNK